MERFVRCCLDLRRRSVNSCISRPYPIWIANSTSFLRCLSVDPVNPGSRGILRPGSQTPSFAEGFSDLLLSAFLPLDLAFFLVDDLQGEEMCVALPTHINDIMLRPYSKAKAVSTTNMHEDVEPNFNPAANSAEVYDKHLTDLYAISEELQKNVDRVSFYASILSYLPRHLWKHMRKYWRSSMRVMSRVKRFMNLDEI